MMHETFLTLLTDRAHWEFELFLMLLFDGVILGALFPFVRKHWQHHIARDKREDHSTAPEFEKSLGSPKRTRMEAERQRQINEQLDEYNRRWGTGWVTADWYQLLPSRTHGELSMPENMGDTPVKAMRHELGHALIGQNEGFTPTGMLWYSRLYVPADLVGNDWTKPERTKVTVVVLGKCDEPGGDSPHPRFSWCRNWKPTTQKTRKNHG